MTLDEFIHVNSSKKLRFRQFPRPRVAPIQTALPTVMHPMHVAVGSTNPVKVDAVRTAFGTAFEQNLGDALNVCGFDVPSGVADQPWGDDATRAGALNRAVSAAAAFSAAHGRGPDFAVGLEGGALDDDVAVAHPDVIGLHSQVQCFAWMAVLRPGCGSPSWGLARTATFELPPRVVALMRGVDGKPPMELGHADDAVFGDVNSKQKGGTVSKCTSGRIDRTAYYVHALHLALAPFVHGETRVYAQP